MTEFKEAHDPCTRCEEETHQLLNQLIGDIQLLASEVVLLRYAISWTLSENEGKTLRDEILSDLYGSYYGHPAYQCFILAYYGGNDPMEDIVFNDHLKKLAKGEISEALRQLTF